MCDSTQVYRHFDIGTAKVPLAEQQVIPHHLVDLIEPTEVFTAGEYRRRAIDVLEDVRRRNRVPVLNAGTGLYLRAFLLGFADLAIRSEALRDRLREKVERRGPEHLHRLLTRLDKETARRLHPADTQKIIRAIEIRLLAAKPVGEIHRSGRAALEGYTVTKIGLLPPRAALYARINARVKEMIQAGWIEEVSRLIASGVPADAKPFQFIGYSQLREVFRGTLSQGRSRSPNPASHAAFRQAPTHMVPQGTRCALAPRLRRLTRKSPKRRMEVLCLAKGESTKPVIGARILILNSRIPYHHALRRD